MNNVEEELEQIPFDDWELSGVDDTIAKFKFSVKGKTAFVIVIFASSYSVAIRIEAANLAMRPNIKWTINGAVLFGVESDDEDIANEMLSFFAGRE